MTSSAPEGGLASTHVIRLVAERENVDPIHLDLPLNDVVAPDALDALFEGTSPGGFVRFEYCGYTVHVDSEGAVQVATSEETAVVSAERAED